MKFCPECGSNIENMKFCSECGFEVNVGEQPSKIEKQELPSFEEKFGSLIKTNVKLEDGIIKMGLVSVDLKDVKTVYHVRPAMFSNGYIYFSTDGKPPKSETAVTYRGFMYGGNQAAEVENLIEIIELLDHIEIKDNYANVKELVEKKETNKKKRSLGKTINCPRCKSANVQLIATDTNIKRTKKSTSININPLKPLTVFNHKEKKKKKRSKGKMAAAVLTGGGSLLFTGTEDNKGREFHCQDCGRTWKSK